MKMWYKIIWFLRRKSIRLSRKDCKPFDPARMRNELAIDGLILTALYALLFLVIVFLSQKQFEGDWRLLLLLAIIIVGFMAMAMRNGVIRSLLTPLLDLVEYDQGVADLMIASALAAHPMPKVVRRQLYHRLALLRYYQCRFEEAALISQTLLLNMPGNIRKLRPQLLLIVADVSLRMNDLTGAWQALDELARMKLNSQESIAHLSLRTRYEVLTGNHQMALANLPAKLEWASQASADQCAGMHLLLGIAAGRVGDKPLYEWLYRRVELLCRPEQFDAFKHGQMLFDLENFTQITPWM